MRMLPHLCRPARRTFAARRRRCAWLTAGLLLGQIAGGTVAAAVVAAVGAHRSAGALRWRSVPHGGGCAPLRGRGGAARRGLGHRQVDALLRPACAPTTCSDSPASASMRGRGSPSGRRGGRRACGCVLEVRRSGAATSGSRRTAGCMVTVLRAEQPWRRGDGVGAVPACAGRATSATRASSTTRPIWRAAAIYVTGFAAGDRVLAASQPARRRLGVGARALA